MPRRVLPLCAALLLGLLAGTSAPALAGVPPLVKRYAPLLRMHPRERYLPMSAEDFIAHARLRYSRSHRRDRTLVPFGQVDAASLGEHCTTAPLGCYASDGYLASDHTRPYDAPPPPKSAGFYLDVDDGWRDGRRSAPAFYYEVRRELGVTRIVYWFFSGYSDFRLVDDSVSTKPGSHEGDWEGVEVVLGAAGVPLRVHFNQHNGGQDVAWSHVCKWTLAQQDCTAADGHPVVYSARGSHASYPAPGTTEQCPVHILCTGDTRTDGGPAYHLWSRPLLSVRAQPWYGFGGAWGRVGIWTHSTGPLGPSRYKR